MLFQIKSYYRLGWLCLISAIGILFMDIFGLVSAHSSSGPISVSVLLQTTPLREFTQIFRIYFSKDVMIMMYWILTLLVSLQIILFIISLSYNCCKANPEVSSDEVHYSRCDHVACNEPFLNDQAIDWCIEIVMVDVKYSWIGPYKRRYDLQYGRHLFMV